MKNPVKSTTTLPVAPILTQNTRKVSLPHNDMHYTVCEFSNFQFDCKTSNLKWNFYFWDRIVIPSHYSKLTLRKQVEFELNRTWNSWNPILCIRWGPIKKHVKTCHNKSRHVMFWKQKSRNVVVYMQILSSFLSRPWLLVCLKDPVWFSTGTLPPRFCTWIPPKPPIPPGVWGALILTPLEEIWHNSPGPILIWNLK